MIDKQPNVENPRFQHLKKEVGEKAVLLWSIVSSTAQVFLRGGDYTFDPKNTQEKESELQ